MHLQDPADAFFVASSGVEYLSTLFEAAAIDPEIHEFADVGVGHNFER